MFFEVVVFLGFGFFRFSIVEVGCLYAYGIGFFGIEVLALIARRKVIL